MSNPLTTNTLYNIKYATRGVLRGGGVKGKLPPSRKISFLANVVYPKNFQRESDWAKILLILYKRNIFWEGVNRIYPKS